MLVCTLGDLTLDVLVQLGGPLAERSDTNADIQLAPGGQAANFAAWVAALGARGRYIGKRGSDDAGRLAGAGLEARGVEIRGPQQGKNAVVCALVDADGERSMLSDRGMATDFRPDELDPEWFRGCDHLFVSAYTLLSEPVLHTAFEAVMIARAAGATISVDLSSWSAIRDSGPDGFRDLVAGLAPDVVFANEDEDRIFGGPLPGVSWVLKRGFRGCSFAGDERAAHPAGVVDSTGAGDALAAGYIVGGPEQALEAAARCVSRLGSMP